MDTRSIDTNKVAHCTFELTGQPMSLLKCSNNESYEAFSGLTGFANDPAAVGNLEQGPLPPGRYYILDRESGGRLGWVREPLSDLFARTDRSHWFSLYRDDGSIDDATVVNNVTRGNFRLHPIGPMGLSEGCVTMTSEIAFNQLSIYLHNMDGDRIPGTEKRYFGILDVIDPRTGK
ncbi:MULTISPECIES: DUF2778 domain-containing protein [Pseudomonas syringae group]|uniref:Tlde1 domain-containing protein n=3 Tax=Pseudomonas syringae group TaxID=136849 RepID=A0A3M6J8N3_PSESG|nr:MULTISPECIES: DUF2778 domain-containing protein [Pseudomonas syringae group]EFW82838.1 hypothetical protein PsgRace4_27800 [Pseudomonas savastanoi pv. glycinea str. race 4]EGH16891.1 hypothetical protein Pgy4_28065 [Pseudomonas savastanoi pv. glycinea str. race 4]MCQ3008234.1 DUF2778 domain-containing protein [Pseudomonas savastanoi]RMM68320.1 hypothetical protein ALQ73_200231 [Pseudomonas savastanoi pv. glycinea]RMM95798.1 hypothetical protein ALQ70_200161 [Pseudomonas savastanoi pv. glyci